MSRIKRTLTTVILILAALAPLMPAYAKNLSLPPEAASTASHPIIDLALGQPYTLGTQWPDQTFQAIETSRPVVAGQLTGLTLAPLRYTSPHWVPFLQQYGRSISVDLGQVENVRSLQLQFLQNVSAGVLFPNTVRYYGSTDDRHWYPLGIALEPLSWYTEDIRVHRFTLQTNVNVQYVRAQFTDKVWALTDQFLIAGSLTPSRLAPPQKGPSLTQLMGQNYLVDPSASGIVDGSGALRRGYLSATGASANRVANMELLESGTPGAPDAFDERDFLPMVGQMNTSQHPVGWLFDGVLFDPDSSVSTTATSWLAWLHNLFATGLNAAALNQAVSHLSQALHDPGYEEKVVIAIPSTTSNPQNFGALIAGGPSLDMDPAHIGDHAADLNKETAIRWFIGEVLHAWQAAHYTHLKLVGLYWQPESVSVSDPYDPWLIRATSQIIHQDHLLFYWIPFDGAYGITKAAQLGFDAVIIQPGVSFDWQIHPAARLQAVAAMAQYYGDGVEIELNWNIMSWNPVLVHTSLSKYTDYFTAGHLYGFEGDTLKAYYLNMDSLLDSYMSLFVPVHAAYTDTEQFINDQWTQSVFY